MFLLRWSQCRNVLEIIQFFCEVSRCVVHLEASLSFKPINNQIINFMNAPVIARARQLPTRLSDRFSWTSATL